MSFGDAAIRSRDSLGRALLAYHACRPCMARPNPQEPNMLHATIAAAGTEEIQAHLSAKAPPRAPPATPEISPHSFETA